MAERPSSKERNETPLERADRNFGELLQELRVTQTGVQILFAFLLTLAFTPRFPSLDTMQRATYVTTLLLAVVAAALFTAPAALHRSLFRRARSPPSCGFLRRGPSHGRDGVLMLALTGLVLLVVDVALGRAAGIASAPAPCSSVWRCGSLLGPGAPCRRQRSDGSERSTGPRTVSALIARPPAGTNRGSRLGR